jgi:hypothetical protein
LAFLHAATAFIRANGVEVGVALEKRKLSAPDQQVHVNQGCKAGCAYFADQHLHYDDAPVFL